MTAIMTELADAPVIVVAPVELPDSEPAISVPVSAMVPDVAIRLTVPAPPSVTRPGMAMLAAVRVTGTSASCCTVRPTRT